MLDAIAVLVERRAGGWIVLAEDGWLEIGRHGWITDDEAVERRLVELQVRCATCKGCERASALAPGEPLQALCEACLAERRTKPWE